MSKKCNFTYDSLWAMALAFEQGFIDSNNCTQEDAVTALKHFKLFTEAIQDKDLAAKLKKIGNTALKDIAKNKAKEQPDETDTGDQQ